LDSDILRGALVHCWPAEHPSLLLPDGIKVPFAGDPFQRFDPVFTKPQSRARNQILNGARHKHFTRAGERRDPRAQYALRSRRSRCP